MFPLTLLFFLVFTLDFPTFAIVTKMEATTEVTFPPIHRSTSWIYLLNNSYKLSHFFLALITINIFDCLVCSEIKCTALLSSRFWYSNLSKYPSGIRFSFVKENLPRVQMMNGSSWRAQDFATSNCLNCHIHGMMQYRIVLGSRQMSH